MCKQLTWALVVSLASAWVSVDTARGCDPETEGGEHTFVISMTGDGGEPVVFQHDGQGGGAMTGNVHFLPALAGVGAGDSRFVTLTSADGDVAPQVRVMTRVAMAGADDPEEWKNRGWLGVQIGGVPESLSDQLDLEGAGTMVLNVVEGSPAEKAGLQQHDVIVAINGANIEGGVDKFVEAVRGQKPGDRIDVTVLRNGQEMSFTGIELSTRDLASEPKWKFEFSPMAQVEEHVNTRGRIMLRDDKGAWVMKDLGDVSGLPADISNLMPKSEHRAMVFIDAADGGSRTVQIKVSRDGETTEISRQDGGEITVKRTDKGGAVTENTYSDEEALKAADEDAAKLLDGHSGKFNIRLDGDGSAFDIDIEQLHEGLGAVRVDVEESIAEAHKAYEEAMKQLAELKGTMPGLAWDATPPQGGSAMRMFHGLTVGKPKHSFEVQADGRIDVRIRKGDSELVQKFNNEQDLEARDPELFAKYQDLMSADRE